MSTKGNPMAVHNPPTSDRTAFLRWLLLFGVALVLMFFGSLWLFSLLPGVNASALYAPLVTHLWGNLGGIITVVAGIIAFVVAQQGIVPALRDYYSPTRREERAAHAAMVAERNEATRAMRLANDRANLAESQLRSLVDAVMGEYLAAYPDHDTSRLSLPAMLRTLRVEVVTIRPTVEQYNLVREERNDLRTRLTEALNQPPVASVAWSSVLPLLDYAATSGRLTVKDLRNKIRAAGIPIPDREADAFSAAVRALPGYSPAAKAKSTPVHAGVNTPISPSITPTDGHSTPATDGRTALRTRQRGHGRRGRALPTAASKVEVKA